MKNNKNKGISLIETVVTTAIFVVASIIIGSLFVSNSQLYRVQTTVTDIKIYKTNFSKNFKNIGESASEIVSSWTINGLPYTTSSSTIVFKSPSLDVDNNIISNTYDYVVFYKNGDSVFIDTEADALSKRISIKKLLAKEVEGLRFVYNNSDPTQASTATAIINFQNSDANRSPLTEIVQLKNKIN